MGELTKETYKVQELAAMLSVSTDTIKRRLKQYKIKVLRPSKNMIRVPRSEAQKLIDRMTPEK